MKDIVITDAKLNTGLSKQSGEERAVHIITLLNSKGEIIGTLEYNNFNTAYGAVQMIAYSNTIQKVVNI